MTQNGGLDFAAIGLFDDPPVTRPTRSGIQHVAPDGTVRYPTAEPLQAPNDLVVAPDGTLYFTDPPPYPLPTTAVGRIMALAPDGALEVVAAGIFLTRTASGSRPTAPSSSWRTASSRGDRTTASCACGPTGPAAPPPADRGRLLPRRGRAHLPGGRGPRRHRARSRRHGRRSARAGRERGDDQLLLRRTGPSAPCTRPRPCRAGCGPGRACPRPGPPSPPGREPRPRPDPGVTEP